MWVGAPSPPPPASRPRPRPSLLVSPWLLLANKGRHSAELKDEEAKDGRGKSWRGGEEGKRRKEREDECGGRGKGGMRMIMNR